MKVSIDRLGDLRWFEQNTDLFVASEVADRGIGLIAHARCKSLRLCEHFFQSVMMRFRIARLYSLSNAMIGCAMNSSDYRLIQRQ
jgi:hypothetical protein